MENIEKANALLSVIGYTLQDIKEYITLDDPEAITLLTGTFNLGFATPTSDIDLLVIYPENRFIEGFTSQREPNQINVNPLKPGDSAFPRDNILIINRTLPTGQKILTNVIRADYLTYLQNEVRKRNDSIRERLKGSVNDKIRKGKLIDFEEQVILHRSYSGLPVYNQKNRDQLISLLPISEIADNVAIRDTSSIQIAISDLIGLNHLSGSEEFETIVWIHYKIIIFLAGAVLASVTEVTPQNKLLFRLLKRHEATLGNNIARDILLRAQTIADEAKKDPLGIIKFVENIFDRLHTVSPLAKAEYDDWRNEADFPLFEMKK